MTSTRITRLVLATVLCAILPPPSLGAQPRVVMADRGPGDAGRQVQDVLSEPHRLVEPDTAWFVMERGETSRTSLVVLGRTAAIAGRVHGDVIVVRGDLHLRPGAQIMGHAIAVGGGVYPSARALALGGIRGFQDETFDIERTADGYRLSYRSLRTNASPAFRLPGIYGLRLPTYDRVNGAGISIGPTLTFPGARGEADFVLTYRSDLGKVDPALSANVRLSRRTRVQLDARRGSFTNEGWIWSDFVNSLAAFATGTDTRNYYRADRGELTAHHLIESATLQIEPYLGARIEDAWSVGPRAGDPGAPWSILGRSDVERMLRPNPAIDDGRITSILAGVAAQWDLQDVRVRGRSHGERAIDAPGDLSFTQLTSDLGLSFPTFGLQEYALDVHYVTSIGDTPPRQRFAYLGGSGTLTFLSLLEQGGDELLHIEQQYSVPIERINLGLLGMPTFVARHRLGSAGVGSLPDFEQVLGLGVVLTLARVEVQLDPASREVRFSAGLSFSR